MKAHNAFKTKGSSSGELRNKTQKAAYQLLQKQESNAKKSRMECLLIQQYTGKYGNKSASSNVNELIKWTVRQFIGAYENVSQIESALPSLETQIKEAIATMKRETKARKENSEREAQMMKQQQETQLERQQSGCAPQTRKIDEAQWPVINAILALSDEQKKLQEDKAAYAKKLKFQQDLDRQVAANKRRALVEQEEKAAALEKNMKNLELFERDVSDQRHQREDKFRTEREMRIVQIEENKRLRDRERQLRIAQEQADMARARRLEEEEEEARRARRESQKRAQDLLVEENERNKELKAEMVRERQEHEKKLNKDYEAKLEREEVARANAFQSRMDALQGFASNYESRVGAKARQDQVDKERATAHALREKERQDEERERAKVETRRQQSLQSAAFNAELMERKRAAKEAERLESLERRLKLEADVAEGKRREREQAEARKLRMLEMRQNLDAQVAMRNSFRRSEASGLSETELNLNKSIIKRLNEDPAMLSRVIDRVNPVPRGGRGGAAANSSTASNIFG